LVATATTAAATLLVIVATTATGIALVVVSATTTSGAIIAATEKLNALGYDAEATALLTGVLVIPLVEFEAAFHEKRAAFAHVLADVLGGAAEDVDINKCHFFALLTGFGAPNAIYGKTDLGDRRAFGRVPQLGVAGQVAHEDDFVKTGHLFSFVAG